MNLSLEVLVTSVGQENPLDLHARMNLKGDLLISNQGSRVEYGCWQHGTSRVRMVSTNTRGVGINRNIGLCYCDAEICLLADEDMTYVDGYEDMVHAAYALYPDADVVLFNVRSLNPERPLSEIRARKRANRFDLAQFGVTGVAAKVDSVRRANIWFSPLFGGGARHGSGEDALFLQDLLKKKLKVYLSPETIAYAKQAESTWFNGYSPKYFFDKGALFAAAYPRLSPIIALRSSLRYRFQKGVRSPTLWRLYRTMLRGAREFRCRG
jgi:glycosyltransferase involved in cell wall biosynthesis